MSAEGISFSLVGEKVIGGNLLALVPDQMLAREAELCSAGQTRASAPTRAPQTMASAPTRVVYAVGMIGLMDKVCAKQWPRRAGMPVAPVIASSRLWLIRSRSRMSRPAG